jgi:hypothetical protein
MSSVTADQRIMPLCCRLSPLRCRFCDDSPYFGNAPPQSSEQRRKSLPRFLRGLRSSGCH